MISLESNEIKGDSIAEIKTGKYVYGDKFKIF